jgi:uncharacterized membrane protein
MGEQYPDTLKRRIGSDMLIIHTVGLKEYAQYYHNSINLVITQISLITVEGVQIISTEVIFNNLSIRERC